MRNKNAFHVFLFSSIFIALSFVANDRCLAEDNPDCIDDFCYPKSVELEELKIPKYKTATFRFLFFKIYTLGLYAKADIIKKDNLLEDQEKALVFYFHREIDKKRLTDGADDCLNDNPEIKYSELKKNIKKLNSYYKDVAEGDVITLVHKPNFGLVLYQDKNKIVEIPDIKFSNAYFGIWLSKWPLSKTLKKALLG